MSDIFHSSFYKIKRITEKIEREWGIVFSGVMLVNEGSPFEYLIFDIHGRQFAFYLPDLIEDPTPVVSCYWSLNRGIETEEIYEAEGIAEWLFDDLDNTQKCRKRILAEERERMEHERKRKKKERKRNNK